MGLSSRCVRDCVVQATVSLWKNLWIASPDGARSSPDWWLSGCLQARRFLPNYM
jgi:hypothetical protein